MWPKRKSILTINDCNMSIMINDHLPWSDIFTLSTRFKTFLKFTQLQMTKFIWALQKQNPSYFSGVSSHTWLHSFFISTSYYKYTSRFLYQHSCFFFFFVFTTRRLFSSSHFYDRNKNISLMLAYNSQLIILYYLLYMKLNKWKCMQK